MIDWFVAAGIYLLIGAIVTFVAMLIEIANGENIGRYPGKSAYVLLTVLWPFCLVVMMIQGIFYIYDKLRKEK